MNNMLTIDYVLTRGVEQILPTKKGLADLMAKRKITLYEGFDPTSSSLHVGHMIGIRKLAEFQKLGHQVIFLIGDFTGMIGDPTDKTATRKQLTHKTMLQNLKGYKEQVKNIIDFGGKNPVKIVFNYDWLSKLTFADVVKLASHFTVQQMLNRDMYRKRMFDNKINTLIKCPYCNFTWPSPIQFGDKKTLENTKLSNNFTSCPKCRKKIEIEKNNLIQSEPIYLHEFLYPLMQGYDSAQMAVDLEIGGNDQMFNLLAGRTLEKAYKNKEKFCLTTKLLTDPSGAKMGKTTGNTVNLTDTPNDIFGKIMALPDSLLPLGFELLTDMDLPKTEPMTAKKTLAFELVKQLRGLTKAQTAQKHFEQTFQQKSPEYKQEVLAKANLMLTVAGLVGSNSEAKRLIQQGAVDINSVKANTPTAAVQAGDRLKIGQKTFVKVI